MTSENEKQESTKKKVSFPVKVLLICTILFAAGWGVSQFLSSTKESLPDTSTVTKTIKLQKKPESKIAKETTKTKPAAMETEKKVAEKKPGIHKTDTKTPVNTTTPAIAKTDKKEPVSGKKTVANAPSQEEPKKLNFPKKPSKAEDNKQVAPVEKPAPPIKKAETPAKKVDAPTEKANAPAISKTETIPGFSFAVQVGAFKNEKNARNFALKLSKEGYPDAYVEQFEDRAATRWNVVRLGQFPKKDDAFKLAAEYSEKHKDKAFVTYADAMMMIVK